MKDNNEAFLREILEQMSTEQLDEMLQMELHKDPANGPAVRMIMSVLKDREADDPVELTPEIEDAWEKYKASTVAQQQRPSWRGSLMLKAASTVLVLFVLISALSQAAEAESFWSRITRWTDSIFELFSPGEETEPAEYVFETDHPGLQKVYDTLVELGVTEPVVPMWLPEGYELMECKVQDTPNKTKLYSAFVRESHAIIFAVNIYDSNVAVEFYKDEMEINPVEMGEVTHNIMQNDALWVDVWIVDNIECSISTDCQEDVLTEILKSIYTMEAK